MYTREQRRLLRILNGVITWKKGKKQARRQKKKIIQKIRYWEKTKKNKVKGIARTKIKPAAPVKKVVPFSKAEQPMRDALELRQDQHTSKSERDNPKYDVLRFPIIDWHYRWQRPQQFSRKFAQDGYRVFYFSVDTVPIENENATFEDIQSLIRPVEVEHHVWVVKLCSYSALNAYRDPIKHPLDKKYLFWSIEALKQRFGMKETVSIVDLPFWSTLVYEIENNKIIYDCMDEHEGFSNTSSELLSLEPTLLRKADIVVASSKHLYNKAKEFNSSVYLIPNAGEYEHFSVPTTERPSDISHVSGPIIGYFGAIADWFDMKLVYELARRNPQWSFVLIGSTYLSDTTDMVKLKNVHFLGEKPYADLPAYLHLFDVCIIPFVIKQLTIATNPVKVYEYLAAGKPVVSTNLPELSDMSDYVKLAEGTEAFEEGIQEALLEAESAEWMEKRQQFAFENSWKHRYESFQTMIQQKLYPKVSIIIVTHNNWTLSQRCLDSVLQNTPYSYLEIVIVDNGSTDETQTRLLQFHHTKVKTILLPENRGFAEANIIGTTNATGDYIILLNNDTIVPDGWLPRLLRPFSVDPQIGAVGPMSNHVGNDQMLDFFVGDEAQGANPIWLEEFYRLYDRRLRYTELLGFFCVAIKRDVIAQIGHLDPNFGYGMFEDDDYCLRMLQAGYRLAIAEDAFIYHQGSAAFKQWDKEQYSSLFHKNKAYYETKWSRPWKQPNMPLSLFINESNSSTIANIVAASGKSAILVYGPDEWHDLQEKTRQKLFTYGEHSLVIVIVQTYQHAPIHGLRKLGPNLYLTNNEELVQETKFHKVYAIKPINEIAMDRTS